MNKKVIRIFNWAFLILLFSAYIYRSDNFFLSLLAIFLVGLVFIGSIEKLEKKVKKLEEANAK